MQDRKFEEYIKARQMLGEKLASTGISETEYLELFQLLDTVTGTDLEAIRGNQFRNDAYDLAGDLQIATGKKPQQISVFLRKFAEHIVRHGCQIEDIEKICEIVDRLPQMNSDE